MGKKVHHLHNNILRVAVDKYRPCSFALLLTRGVKHDQGSRMFLQEAVKGLIGQVEDRRVRLWPGDFRGLRLGGLRTKTGRGEQQGQQRWDWKAETVQLMCNLCKEKLNIIRHSCSPHSTQYVTEAHTHTHTSGQKQPHLCGCGGARCSSSKNEWMWLQHKHSLLYTALLCSIASSLHALAWASALKPVRWYI